MFLRGLTVYLLIQSSQIKARKLKEGFLESAREIVRVNSKHVNKQELESLYNCPITKKPWQYSPLGCHPKHAQFKEDRQFSSYTWHEEGSYECRSYMTCMASCRGRKSIYNACVNEQGQVEKGIACHCQCSFLCINWLSGQVSKPEFIAKRSSHKTTQTKQKRTFINFMADSAKEIHDSIMASTPEKAPSPSENFEDALTFEDDDKYADLRKDAFSRSFTPDSPDVDIPSEEELLSIKNEMESMEKLLVDTIDDTELPNFEDDGELVTEDELVNFDTPVKPNSPKPLIENMARGRMGAGFNGGNSNEVVVETNTVNVETNGEELDTLILETTDGPATIIDLDSEQDSLSFTPESENLGQDLEQLDIDNTTEGMSAGSPTEQDSEQLDIDNTTEGMSAGSPPEQDSEQVDLNIVESNVELPMGRNGDVVEDVDTVDEPETIVQDEPETNVQDEPDTNEPEILEPVNPALFAKKLQEMKNSNIIEPSRTNIITVEYDNDSCPILKDSENSPISFNNKQQEHITKYLSVKNLEFCFTYNWCDPNRFPCKAWPCSRRCRECFNRCYGFVTGYQGTLNCACKRAIEALLKIDLSSAQKQTLIEELAICPNSNSVLTKARSIWSSCAGKINTIGNWMTSDSETNPGELNIFADGER